MADHRLLPGRREGEVAVVVCRCGLEFRHRSGGQARRNHQEHYQEALRVARRIRRETSTGPEFRVKIGIDDVPNAPLHKMKGGVRG